jgi:hypothetical protein
MGTKPVSLEDRFRAHMRKSFCRLRIVRERNRRRGIEWRALYMGKRHFFATSPQEDV